MEHKRRMFDEQDAETQEAGPIDVYADEGEGDPPLHADELEPGEDRDREIVFQRRSSKPGEDDAYDLGLTTDRKPAPKGGWPAGTPDEELL